VVLSSGTAYLDNVSVPCGVRTISWKPDIGFVLNGLPTKILGTANHQDFAAVGVAVPDHLQVHRLRKLKEFGSNGFRTAHNPHNEALLHAADQEGVLVWAENHRNGQDDEMEVMIKRDRNHPSIVIWSICNENLCHSDNIVEDAKRLKALAHRLDPAMGRPVSANYNDFNGNQTPMDVLLVSARGISAGRFLRMCQSTEELEENKSTPCKRMVMCHSHGVR
ncbi:lacZ, partial [Symbiodinium pilosum]